MGSTLVESVPSNQPDEEYNMGPGAICLAVYQPDARLLEVQINSIQLQSQSNWVCHVGIDGFDPPTAALVRDLIDGDLRFRVHEYRRNVGFYRNFERLLREVDASISWVALSDQDDRWYPEKLAILVDSLDTSGVQAVCGQARITSPYGSSSGVSVRHEVRLESLILNNQATGSLMVFRGDLLRDVLPFPEPTSTAFHDHWIGACALAHGRLLQLPTLVQDYVQHDRNVIGEEKSDSVRTRIKRAADAGGGLTRTIAYIRDERWGWRVSMSRRLVALNPTSAGPFLHATAERGLSAIVLRHLFSASIRRDLPIARSISLMVGALSWRLRKFRSNKLRSHPNPPEPHDSNRGRS